MASMSEHATFNREAQSEVIDGLVLAALLIAAFVLGGGSRLDLAGPVVLHVTALAMLAWLTIARRIQWQAVPQSAWWLWGGILALPVLQLIPLPPMIWQALPGHTLPAQADALLNESHWRPWSLAPGRTLNAFFSLSVPFCAFVLAIGLGRHWIGLILRLVVVMASVSALIGIAQVMAGPDSFLYFYDVTNSDASVGLFSNANHHGLFLACAVPCLFASVQVRLYSDRDYPLSAILLAIMALLLISLSLILTFSRAGIGLYAIALLVSLFLFDPQGMGIGRRAFLGGFGTLIAVGLGLFLLLAAEKIFGPSALGGIAEDGRIGNIALFGSIAKHYFPFGSGLGSFDPVFRIYETTDMVDLTYLNNAHNEPAQLLIEAGIFGIALCIWAVLAWLVNARSVWTPAKSRKGRTFRAYRRAASLCIAMALLHSVADYPLRSAAMASLIAIFAAFALEPRSNPSNLLVNDEPERS